MHVSLITREIIICFYYNAKFNSTQNFPAIRYVCYDYEKPILWLSLDKQANNNYIDPVLDFQFSNDTKVMHDSVMKLNAH